MIIKEIEELLITKDIDKIKWFIWNYTDIINTIRERYFRTLNKGKSSWELDYRIKYE